MWFDSATGSGAAELDPFHQDTTSTSWTSDTCRDWKASLKYDYDDLSVPGQPVESATFSALTRGATSDPQMHDQSGLSILRKKINEKYGAVRREIARSPNMKGRENDYVINVQYDRYALGGASYYIHFFLGRPPSEVDSFTHSETYIGSMFTFSSALEGTRNTVQCQNCLEQKEKGVLSTAQIPITKTILDFAKDPDKADFHTMEPEEVETYLETNLNWIAIATQVSHSRSASSSDIANFRFAFPWLNFTRYAKVSEDSPRASLIDMSRLPRTKIFAVKGIVVYPDSDTELSTYSNYTTMWRATSGKPGGAERPGGQSIP
ncbi:hypothetical protein AnigIFM56816_002070 [Aspergillus niger]|nr:hypothetical protein AnigIFM56816_002070 [Aspergillus niger]